MASAEIAGPTNRSSAAGCAAVSPAFAPVALPLLSARRAGPKGAPPPTTNTPAGQESAPTPALHVCGIGHSTNSSASSSPCTLPRDSLAACADSWLGAKHHRIHIPQLGFAQPTHDRCSAVIEKTWGLAVARGTLRPSPCLAAKRLPQR